MHPDTLRTLETEVHRSHTGELDFGALVPRLLDLGVEAYRVDYRRGATTYHFTTGETHELRSPAAAGPIPAQFDVVGVRAAILASQRGEQQYAEFVRRTLAAGCVGYDAWLTGRHVDYHGRGGERWVEWFPGAVAPRPAVKLVEQVYAAFASRDLAAVFARFAPDVEILQSREFPWGGRHVGHDGARAFFATLTGAIDSAVALERFVDTGERVVAIGRTRGVARSTGRSFDAPVAHVWTIQDDLVVRAEFHVDAPSLLAALA